MRAEGSIGFSTCVDREFEGAWPPSDIGCKGGYDVAQGRRSLKGRAVEGAETELEGDVFAQPDGLTA